MGILRDFWNSILDKITGRDRREALPGAKYNKNVDDVRKFKQELERLAEKSGNVPISNGDDLITKILIALGANEDIVKNEAVKKRLQLFVREMLAQKNLDTRYLDIENIKKIIQEIKGIRVSEINGKEMLVYSNQPYRIKIENGSIYLQVCDDDALTKERYCYYIDKSGSLCLKETKYKIEFFGYEVYEENDIKYDQNGIEQKRRTKKMGLNSDTNRRTEVEQYIIRERHPKYPFLVEQYDIGKHGKRVVGPGPWYRLLKLGTLNSLETLDDSNVSFQGTPEIESFYKENKSKIDAMLEACGFGNKREEGRE